MSAKNDVEVIKHSAAIHISSKDISLLQRRMYNVLLANAFDDLPKEEIHRIKLKNLKLFLDYKSNNNEYIKDALRKLPTIVVEWDILHKDGSNEWGVASLLAEVRIINGICEYEYSPSMRKRLHNPKMYAKLSLLTQNMFNSKHTLTVWEYCVDYYDEKRGYGETKWIELEFLKFKVLGLEEDTYPFFKDFNKFVLQKIKNELKKTIGLNIDFEKKRTGRKVSHIKILIKSNPNKIKLPPKALPKNENQHTLPIDEFEIENEELFKLLTEKYQLASKTAVFYLKNKDEAQIEENIEAAKRYINSHDVISIGGIVNQAISENWKIASKKYKESIKVEKYREKNKIRQEQESELLYLHQQYLKERDKKISVVITKFTNEEIKKLEEEYCRSLESEGQKEIYLKEGVKRSLKPLFDTFIATKFLDKQYHSREAFIAYKKGNPLICSGSDLT